MNKKLLTVGEGVWDNLYNHKTKKHLYFEDYAIENQLTKDVRPFAEKVWKDIHNNDTLIYESFDDYINDDKNPINQ